MGDVIQTGPVPCLVTQYSESTDFDKPKFAQGPDNSPCIVNQVNKKAGHEVTGLAENTSNQQLEQE
jgi:hypothetical protein